MWPNFCQGESSPLVMLKRWGKSNGDVWLQSDEFEQALRNAQETASTLARLTIRMLQDCPMDPRAVAVNGSLVFRSNNGLLCFRSELYGVVNPIGRIYLHEQSPMRPQLVEAVNANLASQMYRLAVADVGRDKALGLKAAQEQFERATGQSAQWFAHASWLGDEAAIGEVLTRWPQLAPHRGALVELGAQIGRWNRQETELQESMSPGPSKLGYYGWMADVFKSVLGDVHEERESGALAVERVRG